MMTSTFALRVRLPLLLIAALGAVYPEVAQGQTVRADKLAPVLLARSRQIAGRSRVIVQFRGNLDARVITGNGGVAGWPLASAGARVADLDNRVLADLARNPQRQHRVERGIR